MSYGKNQSNSGIKYLKEKLIALGVVGAIIALLLFVTCNRSSPNLDKDNDGIVDAADQCPDEKGPIKNNGCPEEMINGSADNHSKGKSDDSNSRHERNHTNNEAYHPDDDNSREHHHGDPSEPEDQGNTNVSDARPERNVAPPSNSGQESANGNTKNNRNQPLQVNGNIDFNHEENIFSWPIELSKSKSLTLIITRKDKLEKAIKIDVTGQISWTWANPGGRYQRAECSATLVSDDDMIISNVSIDQFFPNCSR